MIGNYLFLSWKFDSNNAIHYIDKTCSQITSRISYAENFDCIVSFFCSKSSFIDGDSFEYSLYMSV